MTEFFLADDGARIAFSDQGAGQPVLCLAGLTRTIADFDYVAPHLADCRLIRMDYRGRGASDWTGAASYNVPREARDAVQLLDYLGIERAAVLGTSRGGIIGMLLAATAPERMSGLMLNDIGPEIDDAGLTIICDYVGRNPSSARNMAEVALLMQKVARGFANVPEGRWLSDARRSFIETPEGVKINYDPALREAFLEDYQGASHDLWPFFDAAAGMPLGLIRGAGSDLLSAATAAGMQARRPDMVFAEVPDRGHIPWLDEPLSLRAIRAWLARIPAGA